MNTGTHTGERRESWPDAEPQHQIIAASPEREHLQRVTAYLDAALDGLEREIRRSQRPSPMR